MPESARRWRGAQAPRTVAPLFVPSNIRQAVSESAKWRVVGPRKARMVHPPWPQAPLIVPPAVPIRSRRAWAWRWRRQQLREPPWAMPAPFVPAVRYPGVRRYVPARHPRRSSLWAPGWAQGPLIYPLTGPVRSRRMWAWRWRRQQAWEPPWPSVAIPPAIPVAYRKAARWHHQRRARLWAPGWPQSPLTYPLATPVRSRRMWSWRWRRPDTSETPWGQTPPPPPLYVPPNLYPAPRRSTLRSWQRRGELWVPAWPQGPLIVPITQVAGARRPAVPRTRRSRLLEALPSPAPGVFMPAARRRGILVPRRPRLLDVPPTPPTVFAGLVVVRRKLVYLPRQSTVLGPYPFVPVFVPPVLRLRIHRAWVRRGRTWEAVLAQFVPPPPGTGVKIVIIGNRTALQISGIIYDWI